MACCVTICYLIHPIEVRFVVSHPFHKVREKDGAPGLPELVQEAAA
jgi:hypothetical protein